MIKEFDDLKSAFLLDDSEDEHYEHNRNALAEWESEILANENLLSWQQHEVTKNVIDLAKKAYKDHSITLAHDRSLNDERRKSLYALQDACLWIISLASGNPEEKLESIKREIEIEIAKI